MIKLRPTAMILGSITLILASAPVVIAQPGPVVLTVGNVTVDACSGRLNVPVFMRTPYAVGGFSLVLSCTEPSWLDFSSGTDRANWDTVGSLIGDWQSVGANVQTAAPGTIRLAAIANITGNGHYIPPGSDGLLLTLHPKLNKNMCADTSQLLRFDSAGVSDTTGYILYPDSIISDSIYLLPGPCYGNPRGDANCSGTLNGLDVVYLVAYFKGIGNPYCCLCSADANNSGTVNGLDVTFLVTYFKGGAIPAPCD